MNRLQSIYRTLVSGTDDAGCVLLCELAAAGATRAEAIEVNQAVDAVSREASHQNWTQGQEDYRRRFM